MPLLVGAGTLGLTASTVTDSATGGSGGAIAVHGGSRLTATDTTPDGNTAQRNGGALAQSRGATATLTDTHMRHNTARGEGGAVFNAGTAGLRSSVISGSTSQATAGGGPADHGTLTLTTSLIAGDTPRQLLRRPATRGRRRLPGACRTVRVARHSGYPFRHCPPRAGQAGTPVITGDALA